MNLTKGGIPKIIHQTWKNKNIPDKWKHCQREWVRLHPDWTYILWTDQDIRNHIQNYHPEFLEIHDSYEYPIQRADMIRYFILYDYGGVYCDLDMYPLKSLDDIITYNMNYFVHSANSPDSITNNFMISPKNSPIMKKVQERILKPKLPVYAFGKHLTIMNTTGPTMLDDVIKNDIDTPYIILPKRLFNPYSIVEDKLIIEEKDVKNIYINTVDNSSSWNSYDSMLFNFVLKYKGVFISLGILFIILVIVGLIYYLCKYRKCKESKDKCESVCKA